MLCKSMWRSVLKHRLMLALVRYDLLLDSRWQLGTHPQRAAAARPAMQQPPRPVAGLPQVEVPHLMSATSCVSATLGHQMVSEPDKQCGKSFARRTKVSHAHMRLVIDPAAVGIWITEEGSTVAP